MTKKKKEKVEYVCCDHPMREVMATQRRLARGYGVKITLLRCDTCGHERRPVTQIIPPSQRGETPRRGNPGHAPSGAPDMVLPPVKLSRFTPREKRNNGRSDE